MEDKKNSTEKKTTTKKKVTDVKHTNKKSTLKKDNKFEIENKELKEKILRLSAELQNIKRRNDEEIAKLCKYDGEKFIISILPIIDSFERAIKLDDDDLSDDISKFLSGFKMIYANLLSILESNDIKVIECVNKEFDPKTMEALLTEKKEGVKANIVLEELQKGYYYKDKILRPEMVKVSE